MAQKNGEQRGRGRRWWGIAALCAALGAIGLGSFARAEAFGHGRWGGHHATTEAELQTMMERRMEHLLDMVDADDEQRAQVEGIVARSAPEWFKVKQEGRALRQEIKDALLKEPVDRARIEAAKQKLDALATRAMDSGIDGLADIAEILTPEQRKQVADKLARFHH
jgi:Spy/CpxP family protein refolding chaperone